MATINANYVAVLRSSWPYACKLLVEAAKQTPILWISSAPGMHKKSIQAQKVGFYWNLLASNDNLAGTEFKYVFPDSNKLQALK